MPRLLVPLMSALVILMAIVPLAAKAQDSTPTATEATMTELQGPMPGSSFHSLVMG